MRILVTGGAGFIGKHLVKSLIEKGNVVTIFDNFSNSSKNLSYLVDIGAKIIEGDITKLSDVTNAVKDHDIVIHLAAKISVAESIRDTLGTFRVNVNGTRNVLTACKKNHVKKLIASSSAAVYGEGISSLKLTEKSKMNPISPYGQSKVEMEQEIKKFVSECKINYIILRFFNIYGIGQTSEYSGVITKFMERITQNKALEVFGDGMQTRDFVAVQDVIYSIHNAISSDKDGIYNIASGKAVTINELAKLMILLSGKKLEIQHSPAKKGDIRYSQADITSAKDNLGYYPRLQLKEEIKALL